MLSFKVDNILVLILISKMGTVIFTWQSYHELITNKNILSAYYLSGLNIFFLILQCSEIVSQFYRKVSVAREGKLVCRRF